MNSMVGKRFVLQGFLHNYPLDLSSDMLKNGMMNSGNYNAQFSAKAVHNVTHQPLQAFTAGSVSDAKVHLNIQNQASNLSISDA